MMNRVNVAFQPEYSKLLKVAHDELRSPADQLRVLLRQELQRRGLLPGLATEATQPNGNGGPAAQGGASDPLAAPERLPGSGQARRRYDKRGHLWPGGGVFAVEEDLNAAVGGPEGKLAGTDRASLEALNQRPKEIVEDKARGRLVRVKGRLDRGNHGKRPVRSNALSVARSGRIHSTVAGGDGARVGGDPAVIGEVELKPGASR